MSCRKFRQPVSIEYLIWYLNMTFNKFVNKESRDMEIFSKMPSNMIQKPKKKKRLRKPFSTFIFTYLVFSLVYSHHYSSIRKSFVMLICFHSSKKWNNIKVLHRTVEADNSTVSLLYFFPRQQEHRKNADTCLVF